VLFIVMRMLQAAGQTPVESQPAWLRFLTYFLPSRHFVSFSQVIIYRGGGLDAVWRQLLMVGAPPPTGLTDLTGRPIRPDTPNPS
jgi:ABC-2 type transport system permease protein